jgi:peptide/nickel transport system permease protein
MHGRIRESVFAESPALLSTVWRWRRAARVALVLLGLLYVAALLAPLIAPYDPTRQLDIVALKNHAPSMAHWFGTDRYSRDVLSRVLYGARVSLAVASLAVLLAAIVGTAIGVVAGFLGGLVDGVLMRLIDALLAIPRVLLLIAVLALWSPVPLWMLVLLLGLTGWFSVSRLVRAETLSLRDRDFVVAARATGASSSRVMLRHIVPNVLAPVIVATTLNISNLIVLEAGLSFIGVGVREPASSLGTMFQEGAEAFVGTWWTALFPGLLIVVIVMCFNILGDALRQTLDPRQVLRTETGTRSATTESIIVRSTR